MNKKNRLIVIWTLSIVASMAFPFYSSYMFDFTLGYFIGAWFVQFVVVFIFGLPFWFALSIWFMEQENKTEKLEYKLRTLKDRL